MAQAKTINHFIIQLLKNTICSFKQSKKYNPNVDFDDLRYTQKLMIPVIKEMAADAADIAPSPAVTADRAEKRIVLRGFLADFYQLWLFMVQIFVCILLTTHLPELRWKTKKGVLFIKRVFEYGNPNVA